MPKTHFYSSKSLNLVFMLTKNLFSVVYNNHRIFYFQNSLWLSKTFFSQNRIQKLRLWSSQSEFCHLCHFSDNILHLVHFLPFQPELCPKNYLLQIFAIQSGKLAFLTNTFNQRSFYHHGSFLGKNMKLWALDIQTSFSQNCVQK